MKRGEERKDEERSEGSDLFSRFFQPSNPEPDKVGIVGAQTSLSELQRLDSGSRSRPRRFRSNA